MTPRRHLDKSALANRQERIDFIKEVEASLFRDARNLLQHSFSVPRACIDGIHREMARLTHAQLGAAYKEFNKRLCSEWSFAERPEIFGWTFPPHDDPERIRVIRQWLGFFSREHASVDHSIATSCLKGAAERLAARPTVFAITPRELYAIQTEVDNLIGSVPPCLEDLTPRHGPGAVATGEKGFQKYHFTQTTFELDRLVGGNSEFLFRMPSQPPLNLERVTPTTRITAVPKDATSVRIISCEPLSMQFLEQGLMLWFYRKFEKMKGNPFPLKDQSVQRQRALEGSCVYQWGRSARNCTIDLSDASDTIKVSHVRMFFSKAWWELLSALRSEYARFPGGGVLKLETFAPMGSALCYPIECIVFYAVAKAAARLAYKEGPKGIVSAVGDDVIVPAYSFDYTLDLYQRLHFVPNVRKCCGPNTRFREACGGDFLDGFPVDIVRPRVIPSLSRHGWGPMATLAARLSAVGFVHTANACARRVRGPVAIGAGLPYMPAGLNWPCIGTVRWNEALQRFEQQTVAEAAVESSDSSQCDGWEALFQWFTSHWDSETQFSDRTRTIWTWLPVEGSWPNVRTYNPKGCIGRRRISL